jgi:hypothetical protein
MMAAIVMVITASRLVITDINEDPGWEIFLTKNPLMRAGTGSAISADTIPGGLSDDMRVLLEKAEGNGLSLGTVIANLSRRSHAVLIVFLSFPLCIPFGIPVLSTTLGLAIGFVGFLLATGQEVWIPKSMAIKVIPCEKLSYVVERLLRMSGRVERLFHPRMTSFATGSRMIHVHGAFVMLMGLTAAVPLPLPFNNFVAALPVLLLGLSLLERDGTMALVSYLTAIPCFVYYGALIYFGHTAFERLLISL